MYVRCVLIDFSEAFDTINHSILVGELSELNVPDFVFKWIVGFLSDRVQSTKQT